MTKPLIDCALCKDYHVVTIAKIVSTHSQDVQDGMFQTMKLDELKGRVRLVNDKGEQRELVEFTPPKGAGDFAVFFFARRDDKKNEFLTAESKGFKLVFTSDLLNGRNPYGPLLPRNFEFKTSKLMVNDKLEF
jgi:hypothetical protein